MMTQDKYMVGDIEVAMRKANPLSAAEYPIPKLNNHSTVYRKGSITEKGYMPLPVDIECVQDIAIPLRDGTFVYGDLYRKLGEGPVPIILVYTMYSKQGGNFNKNFSVCKTGFPKSRVSGLQCFESPDPAYWCQYGYAICMVDQRGIDHSGGNLVFMGKQAGEDVYDVIEFLAAQDFCSGKVTMMGNSQLAMIQWTAAAAKPPHLSAIAPFEGLRDEYRDCVCRGGIPNTVFHDTDIMAYLYGNNQFEDISAMLKKYPLMNRYWDDKIARLSDVTVPAYVVASWTHSIHTKNSINGFRELGSTDKWMRIHNTHEWGDLATEENADDLRKFFDYFLKGIDNGWEKTPHVRYAVLDFNAKTDVFKNSDTYPAAPTETKRFYLDASNGTMSLVRPKSGSTITYDGKSSSVKECARFEYKITEEMEIHGASNIRLWVSTDTGNDADLYACLYKKNAKGKVRYHIVFPGFRKKLDFICRLIPKNKQLPGGPIYTGPNGRIRASHRKLDAALSTNLEPVLSHDELQLLMPGKPVSIDLGMWPTGMLLHPGETLILEIAGHMSGPVTEARATKDKPMEKMVSANEGRHTIYTGGKMSSVLFLPIVKK